MVQYPHIDPVIVDVGPLSVRWYGFMYLLGFLASYLLVRLQIRHACKGNMEMLQREYLFLDGLLAWLIIGLILGGRLGYVLFYNLPYFIQNPQEIVATWHGGMSFHGGAIGALLAGWIYVRRRREDFFKWADRIVVTVPIGLGLGRIGNFINGELYGRPADPEIVPWAMIFPGGGLVPRHPSQLYEAFVEGVVLFSILWPLRNRPWPAGYKTALFFMLYGLFRFFVEFFREPDPQVGYIAFGWLTMGQLLSIALMLAAALLWLWRRARS